MAHHTSPGRGLLRSASLFASLLLTASACGPDKPPPPSPPTVSVNVPDANVVGTLLKLSVTVSGCDTVQNVTLHDHGDLLRNLPPNSGETLVELQKNEIRYTRGIAVNLSLTARATCANGLQSESQPVAATFFPVAQVIEGGPSVQVVPDYFVAEGSGVGEDVSFLGCGNLQSGLPNFFRVDGNGSLKGQVQMPFVCTGATTITDKHVSSGVRWVWTPGAGVMAINEAFKIVAEPSPQLQLTSLTVDPDGHAIARDTGGNILRLRRDAGFGNIVQWVYQPGASALIGTPVFRPELGHVLLPMYSTSTAVDGAVTLHTLSYGSGPTDSGGPISKTIIRYVYGSDSIPPAASVSFDGQGMYLAFGVAGGQSLVISCPTSSPTPLPPDAEVCGTPNVRWQSQPMQGRVVLLLPYANNSRLAAIAPQHVWFLNPSNQGAILNKGNTALSPNGALHILGVLQGVVTFANAGQDFYLLNGAPGTAQTVELVATDRAENGEVLRYHLPGGDLTAAVDSAGGLWLRVNKKLVKVLPMGDYRQVLPR